MFKVYILYSAKVNQYYTGSTSDISDRLSRHNGGRSAATKKGAPDWEIVYTESYETRSEAVQREMQIKKMKSRDAIERLIKKYSSVGLEHLPYKQGVVGSNPTRTTFKINNL